MKKTWLRFRDLHEEVRAELPPHLRRVIGAAREHDFDIEILCADARVPSNARAPRRFVLVADDLRDEPSLGPVGFDLPALAHDARRSRRMFIVGTSEEERSYDAVYASAVADLANGYDVALVIETAPCHANTWACALQAMRDPAAVVLPWPRLAEEQEVVETAAH